MLPYHRLTSAPLCSDDMYEVTFMGGVEEGGGSRVTARHDGCPSEKQPPFNSCEHQTAGQFLMRCRKTGSV